MTGFRIGNYDVYQAGQRLLNEDGSPGKWMALASIVRWKGNEVLHVPVSWYPPAFDTEEIAIVYAASSAKNMIDEGRCKI